MPRPKYERLRHGQVDAAYRCRSDGTRRMGIHARARAAGHARCPGSTGTWNGHRNIRDLPVEAAASNCRGRLAARSASRPHRCCVVVDRRTRSHRPRRSCTYVDHRVRPVLVAAGGCRTPGGSATELRSRQPRPGARSRTAGSYRARSRSADGPPRRRRRMGNRGRGLVGVDGAHRPVNPVGPGAAAPRQGTGLYAEVDRRRRHDGADDRRRRCRGRVGSVVVGRCGGSAGHVELQLVSPAAPPGEDPRLDPDAGWSSCGGGLRGRTPLRLVGAHPVGCTGRLAVRVIQSRPRDPGGNLAE